MTSFQAAFIRCAGPLRIEVTEVTGREPFEVFTEPAQREYPFSAIEADGLLADLGYERTAPWKAAGDEWGAPVVRHVLSACCGYPVGARGRTTNYYICLRCGRPCDVKASSLQPSLINYPLQGINTAAGGQMGKSNVIIHAAVVDALCRLGTPVEPAGDDHDLYYGWVASDYTELRMHMAGCRPRYELCTWQDRDWREFAGSFAEPSEEYRKGIELTLTCSCGLIRDRRWRYAGGYAELIRAITGN